MGGRAGPPGCRASGAQPAESQRQGPQPEPRRRRAGGGSPRVHRHVAALIQHANLVQGRHHAGACVRGHVRAAGREQADGEPLSGRGTARIARQAGACAQGQPRTRRGKGGLAPATKQELKCRRTRAAPAPCLRSEKKPGPTTRGATRTVATTPPRVRRRAASAEMRAAMAGS
jgi:hypothetical protein